MKSQVVKFQLGQVVITPLASQAIEAAGHSPDDLLARHQAGDWGEVSDQEREVNEQGLTGKFNLVSVFPAAEGKRVTIVTKGDRSLTWVHIDPRHA